MVYGGTTAHRPSRTVNTFSIDTYAFPNVYSYCVSIDSASALHLKMEYAIRQFYIYIYIVLRPIFDTLKIHLMP